MQYYLPPANQVNKDFLKQVFAEEKLLLKKKAVDPVEVPQYDELSVRALWPQFRTDATFRKYFPDNFADGKGPARQYFFNVLNTLYPDYLKQIMAHANEMRWTAMAPDQLNTSIKISEKWQEELQSMPYLSRKYFDRAVHDSS